MSKAVDSMIELVDSHHGHYAGQVFYNQFRNHLVKKTGKGYKKLSAAKLREYDKELGDADHEYHYDALSEVIDSGNYFLRDDNGKIFAIFWREGDIMAMPVRYYNNLSDRDAELIFG